MKNTTAPAATSTHATSVAAAPRVAPTTPARKDDGLSWDLSKCILGVVVGR